MRRLSARTTVSFHNARKIAQSPGSATLLRCALSNSNRATPTVDRSSTGRWPRELQSHCLTVFTGDAEKVQVWHTGPAQRESPLECLLHQQQPLLPLLPVRAYLYGKLGDHERDAARLNNKLLLPFSSKRSQRSRQRPHRLLEFAAQQSSFQWPLWLLLLLVYKIFGQERSILFASPVFPRFSSIDVFSSELLTAKQRRRERAKP